LAVFRRFYRIRPLSALLLCLPGFLLCLWYAWHAYASLDRYRRGQKREVSLTLEDFHISLFDVLRRDLQRFLMPSPPDRSKLERFQFHMSSAQMDALEDGAKLESKRPYVSAQLERGAELMDLELRLRGQRHWHLLGKKKSMKIRLPKGTLLDGHRVFNLLSSPDPMMVGEKIILDLSRKHGVLTPKYSFARVKINGADLGVFHYEAQPDESVLRLNQRMPGSMYSGNLPGSVETGELWRDTQRWKKVAWRNEEEEKDRGELKRLLDQIRSANVRDFAEFARREIDLQAFATFDALDVIFGVEEHDWRQNHKLYFDPYKGRWEPVAWDFQGFRHDPLFNLVDNPLLLRLKLVPEYLSLRNRIIYDLLVSDCSVSAVRNRGMKIIRRLAPDLAADPYWEAYKLLPRVDRFHRRMMRPMNLRRLALVFESEMTTFAQRHAYLMNDLQKNPLWLLLGDKGESATAVHLLVDGRAGVRLVGFRATWPSECKGTTWQVLKEGLPVTKTSTGDYAEVSGPLELHPGVELIKRENPGRGRGEVRAEMVPASYPFLIQSGCAPSRIEAEGVHLATGSRIRSRSLVPEVQQRLPGRMLKPDDIPQLVAGEVSAHLWLLQPPAPESVRLGPGSVEIEETRVFGAHQTAFIAAGTIFKMGKDASLIFHGPVAFQGTAKEPIRVKSSSGEPWGGIALQGPATAGSYFDYVRAEGGTKPGSATIPYPAMVNIHDTGTIAVRNCRFSRDAGAEDVLHAAYVEGLSIEDTLVEDASSDAFDLEFVSGTLKRVRVHRAKDEGLDLMGSKVELVDGVLLGCGGNGISAGEETELRVRDTLVAGSKVGALAKNASVVELSDSLLYKNQTGIQVYRRDVRFQGDSKVSSDVLFVVDSKKTVKRDDLSRDSLDVGRIQRRLPRFGVLDHLAKDVLALDSWEGLPAWVEGNMKGAAQ
jgi:hypothetical protein